MKKLVSISVLSYYFLGTILLPLGDFSVLTELPQMYDHCKSSEDLDMTPIDFITDHLLNIDGAFDKHDNGDKQKPHTPIQFHLTNIQCNIVIQHIKIQAINAVVQRIELGFYHNIMYSNDYFSDIFHPPIFIS